MLKYISNCNNYLINPQINHDFITKLTSLQLHVSEKQIKNYDWDNKCSCPFVVLIVSITAFRFLNEVITTV